MPDIQAMFAEAVRLHQEGRLEQAGLLYRQVLEADPGQPDALHLLGMLTLQKGQAAAAAELIRCAIAIQGHQPAYHFHLALALQTMGDLDGAVTSYRRNLTLDPDRVETLANLGNALWAQGAQDEAERIYHRALELRPHDTELLNNFANLMMARGNVGLTLELLSHSLSVKETDRAKKMFAELMQRAILTAGNDEIRAITVRAFTEAWARPSGLSGASAGLINSGPLAPLVTRASQAWPTRLTAEELLGPDGFAALARDALLMALLTAAPNKDIALERFLTMARGALLEAVRAGGEADLAFAGALAQQCFINEYVFAASEEELAAAQALRDFITAASPALQVLAVACYFPLSGVAGLAGLKGPSPLEAVLTQQVREPMEEKRRAAAMPRLTRIEDTVSRRVGDQYEENPYPRWVRMPSHDRDEIINFLNQKFPLVPFQRQTGREMKDFLVAGCGTGQHPIATALKFGDRHMLAVDLSLASLAHAQRKSQELGLHIEYGQADILELASLGRQFDVIESVGVLHHMADPYGGWKALLDLLRPGGFMRLGLYSATARSGIAATRARIAARGIGSSADDIRRFRQDLIDENSPDGFDVTLWEDFFSTSACRDLLFHAQEHGMRLEQIGAFLKAQNLTFIGFGPNDPVLQAYRRRYPEDEAATNLDNWAVFEQENAGAFASMYVFWVQKAP